MAEADIAALVEQISQDLSTMVSDCKTTDQIIEELKAEQVRTAELLESDQTPDDLKMELSLRMTMLNPSIVNVEIKKLEDDLNVHRANISDDQEKNMYIYEEIGNLHATLALKYRTLHGYLNN